MKSSPLKRSRVGKTGLDFLKTIGFSISSILVALFIGGAILLLLGYDPLHAYALIFSKAFRDFDQVLRRATPLLLAALAVAVPLKAGMFNIGEGQLVAGAFAAAIIGSAVHLPAGIHAVAAILGAMVIGAALGVIPAILKLKFNSPELVVAIMLNTVVVKLIEYLTLYPFRGHPLSPQTATVLDTAAIPKLLPGVQWTGSLVIAIATCFAVQFMVDHTRFGLELKSAGLNREASRFLGINVGTMALAGMAIGGALAAMGGAIDVLGGKASYYVGYYENYGFDGIAISYMANGNPVLIIVMAIIVAAFKIGVLTLERSMGISAYFNTALQGIIIVMLVCPRILSSAAKFVKELFVRKGLAK